MATINNVDFDVVIQDALTAAKGVVDQDWDKIKDLVENFAKGMVNDVEFIAKKKLSGEFNEDDARAYLEDQKILARTRVRSIAIVSLQLAQSIWNAVAQVFSTAIKKALNWTIL